MPFTDDNDLEIPTSGVADWDSPLNGNFQALARGFEFKATAGLPVNTGDAVCLLGAFVRPYDARSLNAPRPMAVARTSLGSGDEGQFQSAGTVRSLGIWVGNFTVGEQVYVDPQNPGLLVKSYSAAHYPVGWAIDANAILIKPMPFDTAKVSQVVSFDWVVGSAYAFEIEVGHRGIVRELEIISDSVDAYKVQFWSGSERVGSEEIYGTVTTSVDGAALDFDVATLNFRDRSTWNFENTDTASPGLIFGTISVQSVSTVGSSFASLIFIVERMS